MELALGQAMLSGLDVPVGAVLLDPSGQIVASAHNERELTGDPTAHAELLAIQRVGKAKGDWRLEDLTLVVTLEPCVMCAGAIVAARIPKVIFGAFDEKVGDGVFLSLSTVILWVISGWLATWTRMTPNLQVSNPTLASGTSTGSKVRTS